MPTEPLPTAKIQSQILPNEDAFVVSVLVARNVGATKLAEIETLDADGNAITETQTVDASRPDSDALGSALNAVVAALNDAGFSARANVSRILIGDVATDAETAKLVVDVAIQKTSTEISPETVVESENLGATEIE